MTSYRQIEANWRNALRSAGPRTDAGKQQSRRNALRHGLTAETIIGSLEDAEDYSTFEAAIIADYDAQSAVERELVLRLASLLWRLRRATIMETGLFEIQADQLRDYRRHRLLLPSSPDVVRAVFARDDDAAAVHDTSNVEETTPGPVDFARCFLRLANRSSFPLDRLSRYEATLSRQVGRIIAASRKREGAVFGLGAKLTSIANDCCKALLHILAVP